MLSNENGSGGLLEHGKNTDHQKCENGRIRNTEFLDRNAGTVLMLESEGFSGVIIRLMRPFICDSQKGELLQKIAEVKKMLETWEKLCYDSTP